MWRIHYGDGSVATSEENDPFHVPPTGVQVIWVEHPQWSGILHGFDFYLWDEWWRGADEAGRWQYEFQPGPRRVIYGTTIGDAEFKAILDRVVLERQEWRRD